MKNLKYISVTILLAAGLLFSCRGGVNKNNDHDYDGKNENNDGSNTEQMKTDSSWVDTVSRYPIDDTKKD